jgi:hypothetical protein
MAVTIVAVDYANDRIVDADIVLNAAQNRFRVLEPASRRGGAFADVQNTVTHELGHALGLQHEEALQEAVMYPLAFNGDVDKRSLSSDDIGGIDALYPLAGPGPGCSAAGGGPLLLGLLALQLSRAAKGARR